MAVLIRLADQADGEAIAAIYRPYVEHTRITFEEDAPDGREIVRRMANPVHPWLVIEQDGEVAGFTSTSPMRARAAYRWSVETGIYLKAEAQGRGLGVELYCAHLDLLTRQGFVTAFGGIALPNPASVALHEKLGFEHVGTERLCGFKLGEWADVGRWQKDLAPRLGQPQEPRLFADVWPSLRA
jgi:L-amino acid N-acyltransferase YncA